MTKVIVAGGGAAGMMAAAAAAKNGHDVTIFEHNEKLGKKLFITGKGRCNLTNAVDMDEFYDNIPRNPKFLYSAFKALRNTDMIALVESLGVPTKIERGGRVFPNSDKSSDVLAALNRYVIKSGAKVALGTDISQLIIEEGRIAGVIANGKKYACDALVLATGGAGYPATGSTGDGYTLARQAGHTVTDIRPSLIPMETVEDWPKQLQGLSLRNVVLTAINGGKVKFSQIGEMLFTHYGVSGPLVLSASACIDANKPIELAVDLKPGLTAQQLENRILRDFQISSRKQFGNTLSGLLPSKLIPVMIDLSGIEEHKPVNQITKEERERYCCLLKDLRMKIKCLRPIEEAIITRGGVTVKEIIPSTMESKILGGLYFAGELIDVDAFTGGFNLQIAFSTGHLAGISI